MGALERGDSSPSLDLAFRICEVFDLPVEAVFARQQFGALSIELYGDGDYVRGGKRAVEDERGRG